jgi:hypothetical protein
MVRDLPPVPQQAQVTDASGCPSQIWSYWLQKLSEFSSDKIAAGYQKFPGGLMIQWGVTGVIVPISSGATASVTFPEPFPNLCFQVFPGIYGNSAVATSATGQPGTGNYSTTGFDLYNRTSVDLTFNWFAVGY